MSTTWFLLPLGPTDTYSYGNGVMAYYRDRVMHIHASVCDPAVAIPAGQFATIVAVATSYGLTSCEATMLADAAERYAS